MAGLLVAAALGGAGCGSDDVKDAGQDVKKGTQDAAHDADKGLGGADEKAK